MDDQYSNEPMMDMFIFEAAQLTEQLEQLIIESEKTKGYNDSTVNEIFRIMHTIKGSAAMMSFNGISALAHSIEDLFFFLREENPPDIDYSSLTDLVLEGIDFIKTELEKIKDGAKTDDEPAYLIDNINSFLFTLKKGENSIAQTQKAYKATLYFEEGCGMENIRAYSLMLNLKDYLQEYYHFPDEIMEDDNASEVIKKKGFIIFFKTHSSFEEIHKLFMQTPLLKHLDLVEINDLESASSKKPEEQKKSAHPSQRSGQSIISVDVHKLDRIMDLVGELVICEAMVTQNSDLKGLELENFNKAARQLKKITGELQDMVMAIRMVSLATTFLKMHRVVRDMCRRLGKEVNLKIIGEETEVDKNIIERISDPLMHIVRNAIDHGIESPEARMAKGKPKSGVVTVEAKNAGSDVLITVKDDGKGLSREKILARAMKNGLLNRPEEEMDDREVYNLIFLPGFSTNESITEFSGRGVGMDVVTKNIESIGGSVSVDSTLGEGTTITLKIPLTLAIIGGMNIRAGSCFYTIPIISIRESFRPRKDDIITDPDGNEMIMVRGQCYPIIRLHRRFRIKNAITDFSEGIFIMVEDNEKTFCIFADELIGEQQVVVKALPDYIRKIKKIKGLAGCTLLGDGSISLILDIAGLCGS